MIPEYKLYHGAVLSELVDISPVDLLIGELAEEGRLTSYILNNKIGLHIKFSTKRMPPWSFTITKDNLSELFDLVKTYRTVFVAFVCWTDGIAVLSIEEVASIIDTLQSDQAWIRIDRNKRSLYAVSGNRAELPKKKKRGVTTILETLGSTVSVCRPV